MINFFRRIRKKLIANNKLVKYLVYASGEIVLIVIGILIALSLNNRNEQRKTEARIDQIFQDVLDELVSNIEATRLPMSYFSRRDSVIELVLTDRVTLEDYTSGKNPYLNNLTNFHNPVNLTQNAYNNLNRELDAVPDRYRPIVSELDVLYNYNKPFVEETNISISKFIEDNQLYGMRNYPWFYSRNEEEWKQKIKYKLENFRYKNEVSEYQNLGTYNQLRMSLMFRRKAISCYKELAYLLDQPGHHDSFTFDPEIAERLIGDWYIESEPEYIFSFSLQDKQLFVEKSFNESRVEVFYLPRLNKILDEDLQYGTLINEDGQTVIKYNYYNLRKVR